MRPPGRPKDESFERQREGSPASSAGAGQALRVAHETTYRYAPRVDIAYHLACLMPQSGHAQQVADAEIAIEPKPAQQSTSTDAFGNLRTYFALFTPHDVLRVRAESRVVVTARFADLDPGASARWETVRTALRYRMRAPFWPATDFLYASPFVPMLEELRDYAEASFPAGRRLVEGAIDLMHRIHADFDYRPASTSIGTPLAEVFARREGVCQDFAQVMLGCLRSLGLPAAYVSGYLLTRPPPGAPRLIGADASHAWVSVWCPQLGWIDLDPTNDLVVGTSHVTLAVGRDFGDVTPLRGVIRGGAEHAMKVAVSVVPA
jgi:transglutaminase-like putative cysteine protease